MVDRRIDTVVRELKHHLPFSLTVSLLAGVLVAILYSLGRVPGEEMFHVLHPAHVAVSALATSAIYYKYKKNVALSVLIGVVGAILIGSLSDVIFPWLSGNIFGLHTHFHLPIVEETFLILGVALVGALIGLYSDFFRVGHSLHVFLSVFASLFYLLAFSIPLGVVGVLGISLIVFVAVYIPCCISDIVFPILFLKKPCSECGHWHEH
jgi:hypothetical protein